jgi:hypothetical protein
MKRHTDEDTSSRKPRCTATLILNLYDGIFALDYA